MMNTKAIATLTHLSSVAGPCDTIHEKGRIITWKSLTGAPWMYFIICDEGIPRVLIIENEALDSHLYNILGYCTYHEVPWELAERDHEPNAPDPATADHGPRLKVVETHDA